MSAPDALAAIRAAISDSGSFLVAVFTFAAAMRIIREVMRVLTGRF